ncbi:MAG: PD-(D/E)XK motif protein [Nitrosomonas sp.]|uniref:PD-(D/E)XK motif protein n=1 Tax=Nitrosomonas sp. TaxID=42353 RepID=UPI0025E26BA4|nr:PD-(D/E)XK motif protein [Nitrosomonas sp.]MBY0473680.1 PD-(D/E)XK motif protein [Nitrosomonas sp.]
MAQQNNTSFLRAWNALTASSGSTGCRLIQITQYGQVTVRAGRFFPDNLEAVLVGFSSSLKLSPSSLPKGNGFKVEIVNVEGIQQPLLSLVRQSAGSLDLFSKVVEDVLGTLEINQTKSDIKLLELFLSRIRAWQAFMQKGNEILSPEAELGLVGELNCIEQLLASGVSAYDVIQGWVGPEDAPQDFELMSCALEVKSTLASDRFVAKISSLEQLDDSVLSLIFLVISRFVLVDEGRTLPEIIQSLRDRMPDDLFFRFDTNLALIGYLNVHSNQYSRRFRLQNLSFIKVDEVFPRLTPSTVPAGVRSAMYEIDIGAIQTSTTITEMLNDIYGNN